MWTTSDAAFVSLDVRQIVVFESHTHSVELVHCCFDVVHMKIQDGERGRGMVWLGIQEHCVVGRMQLKPFWCFFNVKSKHLTVKLFCLLQIVHRKTRERLRFLEQG